MLFDLNSPRMQVKAPVPSTAQFAFTRDDLDLAQQIASLSAVQRQAVLAMVLAFTAPATAPAPLPENNHSKVR